VPTEALRLGHFGCIIIIQEQMWLVHTLNRNLGSASRGAGRIIGSFLIEILVVDMALGPRAIAIDLSIRNRTDRNYFFPSPIRTE